MSRLKQSLPKDGVMVSYCRFLSSMRSSAERGNDKETCVFWANSPNTKISMTGNLSQLFGWGCTNKRNV